MQEEATMHAHDKVLPQTGSKVAKKEQVAEMFDSIASRYDFLNHTLSLGIDKRWRKIAVRSLKTAQPQAILDVATGTGDFAIALAALKPKNIIGIDIAEGMLQVGREKMNAKGLSHMVTLEKGDSEALRFADESFDAVTCAYGVRNFEDLDRGLNEMCRVLKKGGRLAILEFSKPTAFGIKQLFQFYFKSILPAIGNRISKNKRAYTYLQESANAFPDGAAFCAVLQRCGFTQVKAKPLAFGITTLYTAVR